MAAATRAQKTGLLELRVTVDRWTRVLATLTEDTLTVNPGESVEEPAKPSPSPAGAVNGDPPNLSSSPVPETITNVKRTVRVTKQDVGGLGISIKGETDNFRREFESLVPPNFQVDPTRDGATSSAVNTLTHSDTLTAGTTSRLRLGSRDPFHRPRSRRRRQLVNAV